MERLSRKSPLWLAVKRAQSELRADVPSCAGSPASAVAVAKPVADNVVGVIVAGSPVGKESVNTSRVWAHTATQDRQAAARVRSLGKVDCGNTIEHFPADFRDSRVFRRELRPRARLSESRVTHSLQTEDPDTRLGETNSRRGDATGSHKV